MQISHSRDAKHAQTYKQNQLSADFLRKGNFPIPGMLSTKTFKLMLIFLSKGYIKHENLHTN